MNIAHVAIYRVLAAVRGCLEFDGYLIASGCQPAPVYKGMS